MGYVKHFNGNDINKVVKDAMLWVSENNVELENVIYGTDNSKYDHIRISVFYYLKGV